MAKAKSKKRTTTATRTARKSVAALVKAGEAKKRGKASPSGEGADKANPSQEAAGGGRRRWKDLSIEQLQALHAEVLGRTTGSDDRMYLIWKTREAERGNVPVGPMKRKLFEGPTTMVSMKFEETFLEALDAAAEDDGFKSRLGYIRELMRKGLEVRGRSELSAKVAG